jgi:solute carrier family 32 (vesicular inhibitory amino acid transporter)
MAPVSSTMEILLGLDPRASPEARLANAPKFTRDMIKGAIRFFSIFVITVLAIIVPSFDKIMALMGSALCFTICVIMPLSFYLKLFGKDISLKERILDWVLIIVCSVLAIIGTVSAFLPRERIGAAPP